MTETRLKRSLVIGAIGAITLCAALATCHDDRPCDETGKTDKDAKNCQQAHGGGGGATGGGARSTSSGDSESAGQGGTARGGFGAAGEAAGGAGGEGGGGE